MEFPAVLFLLMAGHAVADYPLQGDFLAKAKNHRAPLPGIPWPHGLFWHALIHGGAVALITGDHGLGSIETVLHAGIDWLKCDGRTSFTTDQALHVACKAVYALVLTPESPFTLFVTSFFVLVALLSLIVDVTHSRT